MNSVYNLESPSHHSPTIQFLQDEIAQLKEKINDLEETLKITKNSLKISMNIYAKKEENGGETLKQILSNLEEENSKNLILIEKLAKQNEYYQSRVNIFYFLLKYFYFF